MKNNFFTFMQSKGLRLSLCALALTCATATFAQDEFDDEEVTVKKPVRASKADKNPTVSVSGVVIDMATKKPVAGVRLQVLNDNRYTAMTNAEGKFTIKVPTFATSLFVQAPRYMSQQVAIKSNDADQQVSIQMISNSFGEMYDNSTTYTAKRGFTSEGGGLSIDEEISSKLAADVHTTMHSGNLEQGAAMFIRGINSLNASSQPLVILDGVELDMQRDREALHQGDIFNMLSTISPEDIDKVTVLKNATALYGARGANGVILIDTKRGHSLATRIDLKISAGVRFVPSYPTMMNASQYRGYAVEQLGTMPQVQEANLSPTTMLDFKFLDDNPKSYGYKEYHNDTNWSDYMYRTAITQNYSVNVQGGDDIGMYNLSVAYTVANKNVKETDFNRINVRFNTDISLLSNLTTKFDISFSKTDAQLFDDGFAPNLSKSPFTSPTNLAMIKSPLLYPYQYNANINGFTPLLSEADEIFDVLEKNKYSLSNPLSILENAEGERKNKNENTFFNVAIMPTYEIMKGLSVTTHFSYYLNRNSQAYYRPNYGMAGFYIENLGNVHSKVASIFSKENNIISNTHIDWNKKYGAHNVSAFGGFRYNKYSYDNSYLTTEYKQARSDDKNPTLGTGSNVYSNASGVDESWSNMQWYINGDYSYMNKYFATFSLLAEANSRFGAKAEGAAKIAGTQWAFFPSVQAGWVMTNEDWFPKNAGIDYLRLNVGFDISGNDGISNYAAKNAFTSVRYNNGQIGMQLTNVGNDLVKWEKTTKWNFGLAANFLKNRLGMTFDYYVHTTSDLLALKSFENPVGGINNYWVNDGRMRNQGYEFTLNAKPIVNKNWSLEVGASVGHYNNKVLALANGDYTSSIYGEKNILTAVGKAAGVFYGYKTRAHVFSSTEEAAIAGMPHVNSKGETTCNLYQVDETGAKVDFGAGDVWFVDQNSDGCIDEKDKVVIGNPNPDIYGNIFAKLTWKRFTLSTSFNYCIGNDVYNYQRSVLNAGSALYNQQVAEVGRWRYEGQVAELPKVCFGDPMGNNRFSDRWIEDGSYLRMKNLKLAYNIPVPESWQGWLQGISVWAEGNNLFTVTKYTGNDPEFSISNNQLYQGIDCGNIAQSRSFLFGLKVNL
ncbi:MAG: SusC/RagA family TonB-linked outer membrane protein [Prevotella sp.]|nr:SusC/RagA family TonB-linked outer membrane protein [Candidatus Prevotella equi]